MHKVTISLEATNLKFIGGVLEIEADKTAPIIVTVEGEFEVGSIDPQKELVPQAKPKPGRTLNLKVKGLK